jgi:hypothetical protein
MKITDIHATTVTLPATPLRHSNGVHWGRSVRPVVEVETDEGITGLGVGLDREKLGPDAELYRRPGSSPDDRDPVRPGGYRLAPNMEYAAPTVAAMRERTSQR